MASPQREDGHIDIANEIADKFGSTRISGREWQIIWVVLRKTWGWLENPKTDKETKKKMDAISKSQFAELTGIPRQKCQELLNKLVSKEILLKGVTLKGNTNIATYGFQKDYSKWKVLPKRVTVTLKGNRVLPLKVMGVLPLRVNTKDSLTKETIQKKKSTAFSKKAGDSKPFYLTKKKKKLTGWKLETFEIFWKVFDWKKDKANASDAWLQIPGLTENLANEEIIPAATHEAEGRQGLLQTGHTPKWAQGWLSGRRWEDELPSRSKQSQIKCRKCKHVVNTLISGLCLECKERQDLNGN